LKTRTVRSFTHFSRSETFVQSDIMCIISFITLTVWQPIRIYVQAEVDHFEHKFWTELQIPMACQTLKVSCMSVWHFWLGIAWAMRMESVDIYRHETLCVLCIQVSVLRRELLYAGLLCSE
jgi:hypothetical protein